MIELPGGDDPPPGNRQLTLLSDLDQEKLPPSFAAMLDSYLPDPAVLNVERLEVDGLGGRDVFNNTNSFRYRGREVIAARADTREKETDSESHFLTPNGHGRWRPDEYLPSYNLQDPFFAWVGNMFLYGGVRTYLNEKGEIGYIRTVLYQGTGPHDLREVANGPKGMKGLRPVGMHDREILLTTRDGNRIGYRVVKKIEDINNLDLADSPILYQFPDGTWGNINCGFLLDGHVGFGGHMGCNYEDGDVKSKPYVGVTLTLDWRTGEVTGFKPIVSVDDVPAGNDEMKRGDLGIVAYLSGINFHGKYAQVSFGGRDAGSFVKTAYNPFPGYSNMV